MSPIELDKLARRVLNLERTVISQDVHHEVYLNSPSTRNSLGVSAYQVLLCPVRLEKPLHLIRISAVGGMGAAGTGRAFIGLYRAVGMQPYTHTAPMTLNNCNRTLERIDGISGFTEQTYAVAYTAKRVDARADREVFLSPVNLYYVAFQVSDILWEWEGSLGGDRYLDPAYLADASEPLPKKLYIGESSGGYLAPYTVLRSSLGVYKFGSASDRGDF